MRRVVGEVQPRYVFAENVTEYAIEQAASELREDGYHVRNIKLSAADMGADHIRDRFWLLAYTNDPRELLRGFDAETFKLQMLQGSVWESYSGESGVSDGVAYRMERIKSSGNGQVPAVAIAALCVLTA